MTHSSTSERTTLRGALGLAAVSLAGFGFLYSMAGVGLGQLISPERAEGSLIVHEGKVLGSELVAQPFAGPGYFHPRPSAAGYNAMAVSGSNAARTNPDLRKRVEEARAAVAAREGVDPAAVPSDLVTQSGGGIDPHISPEAAAIQVKRVAATRGLSQDRVSRLVAQHTEAPQFGMLGQARVNVLRLNLALNRLATTPAAEGISQ